MAKFRPGAAHAGHDFVGDQQNAVASADFGDLLQISGRGHDRTQGCPADRFEDEGRSLAVCGFNRFFQLGGILLAAVAAAVRAVVVAAIAIGNSDVRELPHHGQINFAPAFVAGNGKRAQSGAVIALRAAQHLVAPGLSDFHLILPSQLQRGFDGLRTAAGEVHRPATKILAGKVEQFLRVLFRDRSGELAGVDELQLPGLLRHRGRNLRYPVPDEIHGGRAGEIEIALAFAVPHVHPFAANRCREGLEERTPENSRARRVNSNADQPRVGLSGG